MLSYILYTRTVCKANCYLNTKYDFITQKGEWEKVNID